LGLPVKQEKRRERNSFLKSKRMLLLVAVLAVIVLIAVFVLPNMRGSFHDVAIARVSPSSQAVPQGLNIDVTVVVRNQGTFAESFNMDASVPFNGTSKVFSKYVTSLAAGAEQSVEFVWTTAGLALGDYRLNMTVGQVANETDLADNSFSVVLTLSNKVRLVTSMGNVTVELFSDMPVTTSNFKRLAWSKVYDGTIFHRVVKDFVVQGGDPTGTGTGDSNIPAIPDEFTDHNRNDRGTVAMANKGPNTGSSQFFINLVNNNHLDSKHPVFGHVTAGMDVVDAIGNVAVDSNSRPLNEVKLTRVEFVK